MDEALTIVSGLLAAIASGVFGVLARRAAEMRSRRLWKGHGDVSALHAALLTHLHELGDATAADIAVAARLPPDHVAELLPTLVEAGWARVVDESGPLPMIGVTGHGERTAAMVRDTIVLSHGVVAAAGSTAAHATSDREVRALSVELDRVVADLRP